MHWKIPASIGSNPLILKLYLEKLENFFFFLNKSLILKGRIFFFKKI